MMFPLMSIAIPGIRRWSLSAGAYTPSCRSVHVRARVRRLELAPPHAPARPPAPTVMLATSAWDEPRFVYARRCMRRKSMSSTFWLDGPYRGARSRPEQFALTFEMSIAQFGSWVKPHAERRVRRVRQSRFTSNSQTWSFVVDPRRVLGAADQPRRPGRRRHAVEVRQEH